MNSLVAFLGDYSWCDVRAFHREAQKPPKEDLDLEYLRLSAYFEFDKDEGDIGLHFCGIGKPDEHGCYTFGISLTPANELVHLPVRLDPAMKIIRDHEELGETKYCFSLLDVLSEIYWEISFHGSPKERDQFGEEMVQAMEEVKEGRAKLVPLELPSEPVN